MKISYDVLLDATQDDCPIPTIKTKQALDEMASGTILKVVASKEGTVKNMRTLVSNNPYELLRETKSAKVFNFYIKKL